MASFTLVVVLMAIYTLLPRLTLAAENNIITFMSLDSTDRTVMFTSSAGKEQLPTISVPAGQTVDVVIPYGWIGNYFAVSKGVDHVPGSGVIGEVAFNAFEDKTYFDVSAIDDPSDGNGLRMLWPASEHRKTSGCWGDYPCDNAYREPDDRQTKVTEDKHLIALLGRWPAAEDEEEEGDDVEERGGRGGSGREAVDDGDGVGLGARMC
ncbi:hypothetical protein PpBr36_05532 [Pyricularia pennisetigena]|uniref:hypothetical protein n=1 Tax=Pyricularia pennisetigena TaxID=1578925 RepID=UPI001152E8ED|nr:hypothetical protein PpBr36_05532 [Pyricularia pennisetigena]TLS26517.1 hypothetical protein PpBr36_05532 [Pyricularia pennisetigena]